MSATMVIPAQKLERFMIDVFTGLGVPQADAEISAQVLITSDLRGIDSHGVGRLKYYYDRLVRGQHQTKTNMEIVQESETTVLVDGHHGMGHVVAHRCMEMVIDKARRYGMGSAAVRNGTHFGIAGYYPLMAARAGMIGLTVTNARPSIAPTFSTEPMLGTNPIAFAAPSDMPYPFCLDMATSIIQRGKVEVADRAEKMLAKGLVVGVDNQPLTDPAQILQELGQAAAALLPLGGEGEDYAGYKGYGLAAMVEILSASLAGGKFMKDLSGVEADGSYRPFQLGHFFLAIDIEHFIPLETFKQVTGGIMRALQNARRAPGHDRIYVAGEKEFEKRQERLAQGIPLNKNLRAELQFMRDELQIKGYQEYF